MDSKATNFGLKRRMRMLKKMLYGAIALVALVGVSCSSGGSGSNDDSSAGSTDLTPLLGTWKSVSTRSTAYYDETMTETFTVNADGTYSQFSVDVDVYDSDPTETYSYAEKGTITRSGDTVTLKTSSEYEADTEITALPTSGWIAAESTNTVSFHQYGGKLYSDCFTRKGSGSGLVGTWTAKATHMESLKGANVVTEESMTFVITASTITSTFTEIMYDEGNRNHATTTDNSTEESTYTVKGANAITITGEDGTEDCTYYIDGETLLLMSEGSAPFERL
jgi:hypothetical protein